MADEESTIELSDKQRVFVEEYLQCWNATEAARRAGYSEKTARFIGAENLTKPNIRERIEKRIGEVAMSADEVLLRLAAHARGSFEPFIYEGEVIAGEAPKLDLSTGSARRNIGLVKKVKTKTTTKISEDDAFEIVETEVELHDAQAALVHLGRHHKLFTDKTEHSGELKVEHDLDAAIDKIYGSDSTPNPES